MSRRRTHDATSFSSVFMPIIKQEVTEEIPTSWLYGNPIHENLSISNEEFKTEYVLDEGFQQLRVLLRRMPYKFVADGILGARSEDKEDWFICGSCGQGQKSLDKIRCACGLRFKRESEVPNLPKPQLKKIKITKNEHSRNSFHCELIGQEEELEEEEQIQFGDFYESPLEETDPLALACDMPDSIMSDEAYRGKSVMPLSSTSQPTQVLHEYSSCTIKTEGVEDEDGSSGLPFESSRNQSPSTSNSTENENSLPPAPAKHPIKTCRREWTKKYMTLIDGPRPFQCTVCKATFQNRKLLRAHAVQIHNESKMRVVHAGGKAFVFTDWAKKYMRVVQGDRPFQCAQCKNKYKTTMVLLNHVKVHIDEEKYHNRPYVHLSYKKTAKKVVCPSSKQRVLLHHKLAKYLTFIEGSDKPYQCKCGVPFRLKKQLWDHCCKVHSEKRLFRRRKIVKKRGSRKAAKPKLTTTAAAKESEWADWHTRYLEISSEDKYKPYKCKECGSGFSERTSVKRHVEVFHLPEKSLFRSGLESGPEFLKSTPSRPLHPWVQKYVRIVEGDKPYQCKMCGNTFKIKDRLRTHAVKVHKERRISKSKDGTMRKVPSDWVNKYMRILDGPKPFQCTECGHVFKMKGTLRTHIRIHLQKTVSPPTSEEEEEHVIQVWDEDEANGEKTRGSGPQSQWAERYLTIIPGEMPFKCNKCERPFKSKANFRQHIVRTHDEKRIPTIIVGGKKVMLTDWTEKYMRIIKGDTPFQCRLCSKSFRIRGTLRKHAVKMHNEDPIRKAEVGGRTNMLS